MQSLIVLAAGKGTRANLGINKVFYKIHGKYILEYTLDKFKNLNIFDEVIVVVNKEDLKYVEDIKGKYNIKVVLGDSERYLSVYNGVLESRNEIIYVHDGARANIEVKDILELNNMVSNNKDIKCFTLGSEVINTISQVKDGKIIGNLNREGLFSITTPQVFYKEDYLKIFNKANKSTDETSLFVDNGYEVLTLYQTNDNFKVTTKKDVLKLEEIYE